MDSNLEVISQDDIKTRIAIDIPAKLMSNINDLVQAHRDQGWDEACTGDVIISILEERLDEGF